MKSLIQAAKIWVPDSDGYLLECAGPTDHPEKSPKQLFPSRGDREAGRFDLHIGNAFLHVDAQIRAVVVLFYANDLVDGYCGSMLDAFDRDSRDTYLPRGSGLPGLALPCQVMKNENFVPTFLGTAIDVYRPPGRKPGARRIPRCAEAGLYLRRG